MDYDKTSYIEVLKKEMIPAMGCTEPIAVAYAAAKAREALGEIPQEIALSVSGNILKNGMGVGIPGTGMVGLEIAAAAGAFGGNPDKILNVLEDISAEEVRLSKDFVREKKVSIRVGEGVDPLYIEVCLEGAGSSSRVIIEGEHTRITLIEKNGKVFYREKETPLPKTDSKTADNENSYSIESIYRFSREMPYEEISFVLESAMMNEKLSTAGMQTEYGHQIGQVVQRVIDRGLLADDLMSYAIKRTAAATDARMAGCMMPAMSNSGSGNQGITVTMPVIAAAERLGSSEEELCRALTMASLMSIYIKSKMKRLSALCGAMTAGTAASCGIALLLGGDLPVIRRAVQNMVGNLTGIICDGAKPNCAIKVATGVSTAVLAAVLAIEEVGAEGYEGILSDDPDQSIRNLGRIAAYAMEETDREILRIMVSK